MTGLIRRRCRAILGGFALTLLIGGLVGVSSPKHVLAANDVGVLRVWGDITGWSPGTEVVATGTDTWNGAAAQNQTVSSTLVKAHAYGIGSPCGSAGGCFKVKTDVVGSNSFNQGFANIWYDVNFIPVGYTSHTDWGGSESYSCMDWRVGTSNGVMNVGSVQVATSGLVIAATDGPEGHGNTVAVVANVAGPFLVPANAMSANTSPQEAGVCLADATVTNGNEAPVTLGPATGPANGGSSSPCTLGSGTATPPAEPHQPSGQALPVNFRDRSDTYGISVQLEAGRLDSGSFDFEVDGLGDYTGTLTVAPGSEPSSFVVGALVPVRFFPTGGGPTNDATLHIAGSVDTVTYSAQVTVANQTTLSTYVITTARGNPTDALKVSMTACTAMANQDYASLYNLFEPKLMAGVTQSAFVANMNSQNTPTIRQITLNGAGYQQPTSYGFTYFVQPVTLQTSGGTRTANMYFVLEKGQWYLLSTDPLS